MNYHVTHVSISQAHLTSSVSRILQDKRRLSASQSARWTRPSQTRLALANCDVCRPASTWQDCKGFVCRQPQVKDTLHPSVPLRDAFPLYIYGLKHPQYLVPGTGQQQVFPDLKGPPQLHVLNNSLFLRMQPQCQRSWWAAWSSASVELTSKQVHATPQQASLQQLSGQAFGSKDRSSNSYDSQAGGATSLHEEGLKKLEALTAVLGNGTAQHTLGFSASKCHASAHAVKTIDELLSLHKQSAPQSMQPSKRQVDSSLQLQQQALNLQHSPGCPQPNHKFAAAARLSSESAGCADSIDTKQYSVHEHARLRPTQLHDNAHDNDSLLSAGLLSKPQEQQPPQQLLSCTRDSSLPSAVASTALIAAKAVAREHRARQIVPALRPHSLSPSSSSKILRSNSNLSCQNSSRAASIFESDARPVVVSSSRQPSAFNSALRAQFLSVVPDVGCHTSQRTAHEFSGILAAPARAMYDSPFRQPNHDSQALSALKLQAQKVTSGCSPIHAASRREATPTLVSQSMYPVYFFRIKQGSTPMLCSASFWGTCVDCDLP